MSLSGPIVTIVLAAALQPIVGPGDHVSDDKQIVLPAETPVRLTTLTAVDSRSAVQGSRFALTVADDISVGSDIIIPRGTPAVGEVEAVNGKGMFGQAGKLVLRPLFIDMNGRRINLVGTTSHHGSDATAAAAVTTAITPFGLFITGKSAAVPAGSVLFGQVRSDVSLLALRPPPSGASAVGTAGN